MRNYLLRLSFISTLCFLAVISYGQVPSSLPLVSHTSEPLYILNSNIIVNGTLERLNTQNVKKVVVYKGNDGPGVLKNATSRGIIAITYGGEVDSKTLTEIGEQQGIRGLIGFVLNGHKLDAAQVAALRIAPDAIEQITITRPTPDTPEAVVSIQLAKAKPVVHAPGTIMIR